MKPQEINLRKFMFIAAQGLVITVAASSLVLVFTSSPETLRQLRDTVDWRRVPLLVLPVLISWTCNGLRFWIMCRCIANPLPLRRTWAIAVSSEFGVAASPGGVGGTAVRLGFLKKSGISFVHGGSLLVADVFLDIFFFTCITPFALYALLQYVSFDTAAQGLSPHWLAVLLIPALVYAFRKRLFRVLKNHKSFQQRRAAGRVRLARQKLQKGFRQGKTATLLIFQKHRAALVVNFLLTAIQFTSRYSVLPLAIRLLGVPVDPLPLIVMQGALYLVSMIAVAPGGGGSVEVLAALALPQIIPPHLTGAAILLWRLFTYQFYLFAGGAVFAKTFKRLFRSAGSGVSKDWKQTKPAF